MDIDRDDTVGYLDCAALSGVSQRLRDTLFDGAPSRVHAELHFAAEKAIGVQTPEDEIGVGDSWLDSTSTVGNRPRRGAGALRTDMDALLRIEPRDGPAARAHFEDIEDRRCDGGTAHVAPNIVNRIYREAPGPDQ